MKNFFYPFSGGGFRRQIHLDLLIIDDLSVVGKNLFSRMFPETAKKVCEPWAIIRRL
jgi:hypothetical protein